MDIVADKRSTRIANRSNPNWVVLDRRVSCCECAFRRTYVEQQLCAHGDGDEVVLDEVRVEGVHGREAVAEPGPGQEHEAPDEGALLQAQVSAHAPTGNAAVNIAAAVAVAVVGVV